MNDNKIGDMNSTGSMMNSSTGNSWNTQDNIGSTSRVGSELGSNKSMGGLGDILGRFGINSSSMGSLKNSMNNMNVGDSVNRARGYAAANPGKVLGGLAALVIGAGLMRGRTAR